MNLWTYSKADKSFWAASKIAIVFILFVFITSAVENIGSTNISLVIILYAITDLLLIGMAVFIAVYQINSGIEKMINRDLAKHQVKRVNNYDVCVVSDQDDSLCYILYQDMYYYHDGQKGVYSVHTSSVSPVVKWYEIIFDANTDKNIQVICEKTKDKDIVSVYKQI